MKITGICAEYNFIHNGHKLQLDTARKNSDAVIVIMSGGFVQRGDAAVFDKWTRAKAALLCGADLVLELPAYFAVNTAQKFALGAVSILNSLNVTDNILFGSESGDISALFAAAEILENETPETGEKIRSFTSSGMSYPAAREKAYKGIIPGNILSMPNNILAVEYIRAIIRLKSSIKPVTMTRLGTGYHDTAVSKNIASATAIRSMMEKGDNIKPFIPESVHSLINTAPFRLSEIDNAVLYFLRNTTLDYLMSVNDIDGGIAARIMNYANQAVSIDSLADLVKTKRYTHSRIKRCILSAFLGFDKTLSLPLPSYARVLGMNETGMAVLKTAKIKSAIPIITKAADFTDNMYFAADVRANNAAMLCCTDKSKRIGNTDYTTSPVIIR